MKLIDADAFSRQVAAMSIRENYPVERVNAMIIVRGVHMIPQELNACIV